LGLLGRLSTRWQGSLLRNAPRPLLVSLRNTGRRKARLLLTLATLILAGAIFIGVRSVEASMDAGLARMYRYYLGDVNVNFDRPYPVTEMVGRIAQLPGVARVEGWLFAAGSVVGEGENASARLTVAAPPANSTLVAREVEEGRWLRAEDKNAIVMCTRIMDAHPEWEIGSTVRLALDNRVESNFVIVGTFPFPSGEGNNMAVADYAHLAGLLDQQGQSSTFRLLTSPRDAATQDQVRDALLTAFQEEGYAVEVTSGHTTADALNTILNALVLFLLLMALLVALVGALGLAGTMSINVLERTREIGVMRAIGATNGAVMQLVVVEGLLTGLLSWLVGAIVSVPVGIVLAQILGQGLFDTPFAFVLDGNSLLVWLAIVALLSVVSSALPAWNAARLTVREALAYE
jgi:putative ABC transport system permease protein